MRKPPFDVIRRWALPVLVVAHLVAKVALWPSIHDAELTGDEGAYRDGAGSLSNLLRALASLEAPDLLELKANLISNGWFMPGMSLVLAPLYVVVPDPSVTLIRTYIGILSSVALLALALWAKRALGYGYACVVMVVPGLVPMWLVFSYSIWGDLYAGLASLGIVLTLYGTVRGVGAAKAVPYRRGVSLGVLAVVCVYLRSSALPLAVGAAVLFALAVLALGEPRSLRRRLAVAAVPAAVFIALLAPWSLAASKSFDTPVITTTTTPLSLAVTFGDIEELCFGPCGHGRKSESLVWFDSVRYSREVAVVTGASEIEIQGQMAEHALRNLTAQHYFQTVARNMRNYLLSPTSFSQRFFPGSADGPALNYWPTNVLLAVAGGAMVLVMLDLRRTRFSHRVLRTTLKLFLLASLLQPFLHPGSGRYWPLFAPLLGIGLAFLAKTVVPQWLRADDEPEEPVARRAVRVVTVFDAAASLVFVSAAVALLAASG